MDPHEVPVALSPIYSTARVNDAIELFDGAVTVGDKDPLKGSARVNFRWEPTPRVRFEFRNRHSQFLPSLGGCTIHLLDAKRKLSGHVTRVGWTSPRYPDLGEATGQIFIDETAKTQQRLRNVVFHVANFHDYAGARVSGKRRTTRWAGRAVLNFEPWRVILDSIYSTGREFRQTLADVGGFGITHVGRMERVDGGSFGSKEASDVLEMLGQFFSFCRGTWCEPQLPIGFDSKEQRAWERWQASRTDRWMPVRTWFSSQRSEGLEHTISGFSRRYASKQWGEPLRLANYWYVEANTGAGGIEGATILVQAALELLAWTLLVEERKLLSEDGFHKLPAMDKIRIMLDSCSIPLKLPIELKDLGAMALEYNYRDGAQAFTEIRNGLVHSNPDKRARILRNRGAELYDASRLGLWYLELILLFLCDYKGHYSCRLVEQGWKGAEVRQVPWVRIR